MDFERPVIPTTEPITDALVAQVRESPNEYFDMIFDMEEADRYPTQRLTPILAQGLLDTPMYRFLIRIVGSGVYNQNIKVEIENENERELMRVLYQRTPSHVLIRLREAIGWTLDVHRFSEEFWEILIANVTDPYVYTAVLGTAGSLTSRRQDDDNNDDKALIYIMLYKYRYDERNDMIAHRDTILNIAVHLGTLFEALPVILVGDADAGETLLDKYIREHPNNTRHQFFVTTIARAMVRNHVPFIYWSTDPETPMRTKYQRGGVFHALLRHFVDRDTIRDDGDHVGTIPLHYENFAYVWNEAKFEERKAMDYRDHTPNRVAHILMRKSTGRLDDLAKVITLTGHMTKSAAGQGKAQHRHCREV